MLIGLSGKEAKMVFLVDFGMCRTYVRKETDGSVAIRPPREKAFVRGILRYPARSPDLTSIQFFI